MKKKSEITPEYIEQVFKFLNSLPLGRPHVEINKNQFLNDPEKDYSSFIEVAKQLINEGGPFLFASDYSYIYRTYTFNQVLLKYKPN